jgi:hypothetical protein
MSSDTNTFFLLSVAAHSAGGRAVPQFPLYKLLHFVFFFKNLKDVLLVLQNSCRFFCRRSKLDAIILIEIISKGAWRKFS